MINPQPGKVKIFFIEETGDVENGPELSEDFAGEYDSFEIAKSELIKEYGSDNLNNYGLPMGFVPRYEKEQPVKLIEEVIEKPKQKLYEKKLSEIYATTIEKDDEHNIPVTTLKSIVGVACINRTEAISLAIDLVKRSHELQGEPTDDKSILGELNHWCKYLLETDAK